AALASKPQPLARRVKERLQRNPRRDALRGDLHLIFPGRDPFGTDRGAAVGDVTETERTAERVAEGPGRDGADELAVPPDRLVVVEEKIGALRSEEHTSELQ